MARDDVDHPEEDEARMAGGGGIGCGSLIVPIALVAGAIFLFGKCDNSNKHNRRRQNTTSNAHVRKEWDGTRPPVHGDVKYVNGKRYVAQEVTFYTPPDEVELMFGGDQIMQRGVNFARMNKPHLEPILSDSHMLYQDSGGWTRDNNYLCLDGGDSYSFGFKLADKPKSVQLVIRHRASGSNESPDITPITMYVNQREAAKWNQVRPGVSTETFFIQEFLQRGQNTIQFEHDSRGSTGKYLQKYVHINVLD